MLDKPYIIPARPEILSVLTDLLSADEPDIDKIVSTLKSDVSLYTLIISLVNRPVFISSGEIKTLHQAVMRLGLKRLYTLIELTLLQRSLSQTERMDRFWDSATEVAEIMSRLAKFVPGVESDSAYTVGMLHDCGIPLMMENMPDYSGFLRNLNQVSPAEFVVAENQSYGVNRYKLGAEIARVWKLPDTECTAIELQQQYPFDLFDNQTDFSERSQKLCCLIQLAKDISQKYRHYWRIEQKDKEGDHLHHALRFLGISEVDYWDIRDDLLEELEAIK